MTRLEPLKFRPSLHEKVWGTHDLRPVLKPASSRIGEAWCLHDGSVVASGSLAGRTVDSLIQEYGSRIMGLSWRGSQHTIPRGSHAVTNVTKPTFPIAAKLLFGAGNLSVQVHPDDRAAGTDGGQAGKTELWYVIAAGPESLLGLGLDTALTPEQLFEESTNGTIERFMRWIPARQGDCVLVPAGTVHSAGGGVTLCEIQQNSDLTYRLYDYRREGLDGQLRSVHVERAVKVARIASRPQPRRPKLLSKSPCRVESLGRCPYFAAELLTWNGPFLYTPDRQKAEILTCIRGHGALNAIPFVSGDAFLIPAEAGRFPVDGIDAQAVRAYLP